MPRCLIHKTKFTAKYFLQKHCLETDECQTAETKLIVERHNKHTKKKVKEVNERLKQQDKERMPFVYDKEYRKELQDATNKLSRMVDEHFGYGCIDCGKPLDKEKNQIDACHLISRGKNSTLKYHLDNLHSGHNHCNKYNEKHESNYKHNLVLRYGHEYLEQIEGLPLKYPLIKLSEVEVVEKLKLVRKLIRDFTTFEFMDGRNARNWLNALIGIYK